MTSLATGPEVKCSNCGAPLSASLRHCPTCRADAGAPNVRACRTEENLKALTGRFDDAKAQASANKCSREFSDLSNLIEHESGVVIAMPAAIARTLVENAKELYVNYDRLVGSKIRKPAGTESDRQRAAVGGMIFGAYANDIIYGVLSLTTEGLPTYGDVYCRLREVTVSNRTSFLETNSYKFVEDHDIRPGEFPEGYRASWEDRHILVLAKLADRLTKGQTRKNWQEILIESDGKHRENDNFVEAHVYEGFDRIAIESMVVPSNKKLSRENRLDSDIALAKFNELSEKTQ